MISVITCALPRGTEWLSEAWRSLEDQTLPPDWQWEWLLQIDGPEKLRSSVPQDDPRIRITRNPRNFGAATARTLALGRAGGELVAVLDADDIMLPGHLSRAIAVMETHGAEWTASVGACAGAPPNR
jgi:glycosyltransferase involved in cell wall biosynthesis